MIGQLLRICNTSQSRFVEYIVVSGQIGSKDVNNGKDVFRAGFVLALCA